MTVQFRLGALILAGSAACAPAFALDLPPRKAGLWLVTMAMSGSGGMPARETRMCTDDSTEAAITAMGGNMMQGVCSKRDIKRNGDTVTGDSVCQMGQTQMTSHSDTRFTGNAAYHTDIKTRFDPPMMGRTESTMTQDGKWIGPCPADMQPGDVVMPNGMKMNVKTMMSGPDK
jgi:hypothetical protein